MARCVVLIIAWKGVTIAGNAKIAKESKLNLACCFDVVQFGFLANFGDLWQFST
jgi:hypothetical protein